MGFAIELSIPSISLSLIYPLGTEDMSAAISNGDIDLCHNSVREAYVRTRGVFGNDFMCRATLWPNTPYRAFGG